MGWFNHQLDNWFLLSGWNWAFTKLSHRHRQKEFLRHCTQLGGRNELNVSFWEALINNCSSCLAVAFCSLASGGDGRAVRRMLGILYWNSEHDRRKYIPLAKKTVCWPFEDVGFQGWITLTTMNHAEELKWSSTELCREFFIEMVLDRAGNKELKPAKDATVKRVNMGRDTSGSIQNMPEGRSFLVRVVGKIPGKEIHSAWTRAVTLSPKTRDKDLGNLDPMNMPRISPESIIEKSRSRVVDGQKGRLWFIAGSDAYCPVYAYNPMGIVMQFLWIFE